MRTFCAVMALWSLMLGPAHAGRWVSLFNGRDLKGWTPKIKGYPLGENFGNTFRVSKGVLQVRYDGYGGKFQDRFGHLFFERPFANYILKLEYRFVGEQLPDGPGWAWRNSGIMIHGQTPESMLLDQDFPVSAEFQLLGGPQEGERPTGNLCTPGTNVMLDGKLYLPHVKDSSSPTFRGDRWVRAEVEVHGSGEIIHRIEGKEVLRYTDVQYDARDPLAQALRKDGPLSIGAGSISLQSESHPVDFRRIFIQELPMS